MWGGACVRVCVCIHVTCTKFIYGMSILVHEFCCYSDATHGAKQTACLCLLRILRVNAGHVPIDQYTNKIVQLLNEK